METINFNDWNNERVIKKLTKIRNHIKYELDEMDFLINKLLENETKEN